MLSAGSGDFATGWSSMEALVKVETLLLVLCTSWGLTGALQLELASVVSVTVYSLGPEWSWTETGNAEQYTE